MPETLGEKVSRHLQAGQVDPGTLVRGVKQSFGYFLTRNEAQGQLVQEAFQEESLLVSGLVVARYYYKIPQFPPAFQRLLDRNGLTDGLEHKLSPAIYVVEFPLRSRFNVYLDDTTPGKPLHTRDFFKSQDVSATFTGPTFKSDESDYLPNNGFYYQGSLLGVDFRDTNPSGLRRGAFAIFPSGRLIVLDDTHKWALVRSGYPAIRALVGTSYYFTQDTQLPDDGYDDKMQASYLMQYRSSLMEESRTCFVLSTGSITRHTTKAVIDDFVRGRGGLGYIAAEMEMSGATCMIRRGETANAKEFGGGGFFRRDHYGVTFPGEAHPVVDPDPLQSVLDKFWAGILGRRFHSSRVTIPEGLDQIKNGRIIPSTIHDYGQYGLFVTSEFLKERFNKIKS